MPVTRHKSVTDSFGEPQTVLSALDLFPVPVSVPPEGSTHSNGSSNAWNSSVAPSGEPLDEAIAASTTRAASIRALFGRQTFPPRMAEAERVSSISTFFSSPFIQSVFFFHAGSYEIYAQKDVY